MTAPVIVIGFSAREAEHEARRLWTEEPERMSGRRVRVMSVEAVAKHGALRGYSPEADLVVMERCWMHRDCTELHRQLEQIRQTRREGEQ